jgi:hypothetical protein
MRRKGRHVHFIRIVGLVVILGAGIACAADKQSSETGGSQPPPAASAVESGSAGALALPGATIDRPDGWTFRQPSSSMRLAEAEIPGPAGPALLTVFFFGAGGGGGVDANLDRWAGQIELDPGAAAERGGFEVNGYSVSVIEAVGTLLPSRMGGGPTESAPDSKLLGAVIEGPGGPWFFKVTGPKDTVSAAAPAFEAMLQSIRP